MAETETDQARLDLENKAVQEATSRYEDLVTSLIFIATSSRTRKEKMALISEQKKKMLEFNNGFSKKQTELFYGKFTDEAFNEAKTLEPSIGSKKKLSFGQNQELKSLSEELKLGLNKRLDTLINEAERLTVKEELARIREEKIGLKAGSEKTQITPTKSKKDLPFTNSKGQRVKMNAVMKLTVGDPVWNASIASQRSEWVRLGFRYVQHISVLDDKTTLLCRGLHKTRRDLLSDPLPPMHIGCRSKVKLLKEGWNEATFLKNFK